MGKELYRIARVPEGKGSSENYPKFQDVVIARERSMCLIVYSMRYANAIMYQGLDGDDL